MTDKPTKEGKVKELMRLCQSYIAKFGVQKFVDAKLNDGTTVVRFPSDKMSKGDIPMVVTEEGELPMPDSAADVPYVLEDGTSFTIVNGAIDMIVETEKEPEEKLAPPPPPAPEAKTKTDMENKPKRVIKSSVEEHVFSIEFENEVIEIDLSEMFSMSNKKIEALEKENKTLTDKFTAQLEINKGLAETIEMIADEPAVDPIEKKKIEAKKFGEMTPLERYRFMKENEK